MKILLPTYKNSHLFALATAGFVHVTAGLWAVLPSDPVVLNKQAIRVSFVAPNASEKKSENDSHLKNLAQLEEKNALKKSDKKELAKNDSKNSQSGKNTSGLVDPNAIATNSAQSEPVFDAAYLNNPTPAYPQDARRKGVQGKVLVKVLVKTDGSPQSVDIASSSGHTALDEAALDAVKQWRFIPAKQKGKSVQASVIVPVEFKII